MGDMYRQAEPEKLSQLDEIKALWSNFLMK